jgi:hypothetical protein
VEEVEEVEEEGRKGDRLISSFEGLPGEGEGEKGTG